MSPAQSVAALADPRYLEEYLLYIGDPPGVLAPTDTETSPQHKDSP